MAERAVSSSSSGLRALESGEAFKKWKERDLGVDKV